MQLGIRKWKIIPQFPPEPGSFSRFQGGPENGTDILFNLHSYHAYDPSDLWPQ